MRSPRNSTFVCWVKHWSVTSPVAISRAAKRSGPASGSGLFRRYRVAVPPAGVDTTHVGRRLPDHGLRDPDVHRRGHVDHGGRRRQHDDEHEDHRSGTPDGLPGPGRCRQRRELTGRPPSHRDGGTCRRVRPRVRRTTIPGLTGRRMREPGQTTEPARGGHRLGSHPRRGRRGSAGRTG